MDRITIAGREYVSPDACAFGDYGGASDVGLANIRAILADAGPEKVCASWYSHFNHASDAETYWHDDDDVKELREAAAAGILVFHLCGDYSSETVYLLADHDYTRETLAALESYPCLDDDAASQIVIDWENEAWDSWIKADLDRAAWPQHHEPAAEHDAAAYDSLAGNGVAFECYRDAMETCNEYVTPEYSGVHVDVDRIAATYRQNIEAAIRAGRTLAATRDDPMKADLAQAFRDWQRLK